MIELIYIVMAGLGIALISLAIVVALAWKDKILNEILLLLVALSAGTMIGGAFLHLIPESIKEVGEDSLLNIFLFVLLGFVVFFVLEQFISWHHCHKTEHSISSFSYLILIQMFDF